MQTTLLLNILELNLDLSINLINANSKITVLPHPVGAEMTKFLSDLNVLSKHIDCIALKYLNGNKGWYKSEIDVIGIKFLFSLLGLFNCKFFDIFDECDEADDCDLSGKDGDVDGVEHKDDDDGNNDDKFGFISTGLLHVTNV